MKPVFLRANFITIVTNKERYGWKGTLVVMVHGAKSEDVIFQIASFQTIEGKRDCVGSFSHHAPYRPEVISFFIFGLTKFFA
jgi:hypothetical protein